MRRSDSLGKDSSYGSVVSVIVVVRFDSSILRVKTVVY